MNVITNCPIRKGNTGRRNDQRTEDFWLLVVCSDNGRESHEYVADAVDEEQGVHNALSLANLYSIVEFEEAERQNRVVHSIQTECYAAYSEEVGGEIESW